MHIPDAAQITGNDDGLDVLTRGDVAAIEALFDTDDRAGRFFAPHLLDDRHYLGRRDGDHLIAVAGTHTYSPTWGVASVANVHTHPDHRRRGLARHVVAAVSRRLLRTVPTVALNVRADHPGTITLYRELGFEIVADYDESHLVRHAG